MATVPAPSASATAPDAALALSGVVRTFGAVTALDGIDLRVRRGEVVGLLGHNGAGKTTTVRVLVGLLPPNRGDVRVEGRDPARDGPWVRRRVGVLPARPVVDNRLTARQNLRFAGEVFQLPADDLERRIQDTLALFELAGRADERVAGFSSGMRQRLSLARVLLPDPAILLLDEPTSALDPVATRQVRELLAELAAEQQRTIVICTHDLPEAEQLCDRVVVLERGRVVADGSPGQLAAAHGTAAVRVEVRATDLDRAIELLGTLPAPIAVSDVEREHGLLTVSPVTRDDVPALLHALITAGVDVFQLRRLEPSLEDVYLALHRRREGAGDPAGGRGWQP